MNPKKKNRFSLGMSADSILTSVFFFAGALFLMQVAERIGVEVTK
jgi:hypothetical protein